MYVSPATPQEALDRHPVHVAYVESLTADKAPAITIDADPDGPDESIQFVFVAEESLGRFKEFILAEMRRSNQLLQDELAAGITPVHYAQAPCLNS
jgi:hypothetical protein